MSAKLRDSLKNVADINELENSAATDDINLLDQIANLTYGETALEQNFKSEIDEKLEQIQSWRRERDTVIKIMEQNLLEEMQPASDRPETDEEESVFEAKADESKVIVYLLILFLFPFN